MYRLLLLFMFTLLSQLLFAQNLEDCFFPINKLQKTKVYQFEVAQKPELTQYWKMKSVEKNEKWILTTQVYNADFQITELAVEWIDSTGSKLEQLIQFDEKGKGDTVELVENDVFRWQQKADETIRWSMLFNNDENETLFFAKERTHINSCSPPQYRGKNYYTVCFKDALHSVNSDTYEELFTFSQISYYANHLGLIGFDRSFEYDEQKNVNFRLVKILKEKKWRKLKP
ncbi:MAG: hypothetical protein R3E32_22220 [Chitinophagales bacterium]